MKSYIPCFAFILLFFFFLLRQKSYCRSTNMAEVRRGRGGGGWGKVFKQGLRVRRAGRYESVSFAAPASYGCSLTIVIGCLASGNPFRQEKFHCHALVAAVNDIHLLRLRSVIEVYITKGPRSVSPGRSRRGRYTIGSHYREDIVILFGNRARGF